MSLSGHKRAPFTNFYSMNAGGTAVQKRTKIHTIWTVNTDALVFH